MPGPSRRRPVVAGQRARQRRETQTAQPVLNPPTEPLIASEAALQAGEERAAHQERELGTPLGLPPGLPPEAADAVAPEISASGREAAVAAAPRSTRGLTAALAVLLVLLLGAAWLIGLPSRPADRYTQQRVDALAAAQSAATDLLSVNYESIQAGQKKAAGHLAPKFRAEYTKFFTDLQTTAVKNKLVLTTHVEAGGVTSIKDADHVVALLFIDQISTNAQRSSPRIDQNRVRLRMVHTGGKWLVEGLDAI